MKTKKAAQTATPTTTGTPGPAPAPAAKPVIHRGLLDKHQLAEISYSNTIYGIASDPATLSDAVHYKNSAISVDCYQLNKSWNEEKSGVLAIVEVSYITFDLDKLVDGFMQNYPNARKEKNPTKLRAKRIREFS